MPLSIGHPVKFEYLVLLYEPQQLPLRTTFDQKDIVLRLRTGNSIKASHVLIGAGWRFEGSGVDFKRLKLSGAISSVAISSADKEIPVTPSFSVILSKPLKAELNKSPGSLWFVFPGGGDTDIDEIQVNDVKLIKRNKEKR